MVRKACTRTEEFKKNPILPVKTSHRCTDIKHKDDKGSVMSGKRTDERHKKRLKLRFGVGSATTLGFTEDISQEGLFISTPRVRPANTLLTVELTAANNEMVVLEGMVQWSKSVSPSMARFGKKGGMGIKISRFISGQEAYNELCGILAPGSRMGVSTPGPAEVLEQHVKELDGVHSEEIDGLLDTVKEKRLSPRLRSLNLTSYLPKKNGQQEHIVSVGRTLDVSEGGAKLETHRPIDKGTILELALAVENSIITAEGEVLYSEELGDGLFGTGVCFTSIKDEDRHRLK
jgi:hypothetical protein